MKLRFWGVRGSTPTASRENLRYGGNTPCLEIRTENGDLFIFDCGTGLRALGKRLLDEFGHSSISAFVFLTHYHWDHIQGLPFFEPLYNPENYFFFHSFPSQEQSVQRALEEQMTDPYFPVNMEAMAAHRHFYTLANDRIAFDDATLSTTRLNHPQGCMGYRIESRGKVIVYATDNEPGVPEYDENVRKLAAGADVLIYDAQYTPLEYVNFKKGWGHSTWREGVNVARDAGAKMLVLFHHDPDHDDDFIDGIVGEACRHFPNVVAAAEGMQIDVAGDAPAISRFNVDRRSIQRQPVHLPLVVEGRTADGRPFIEHTVMQNISLKGAFFELANDPDPRIMLELKVKISPEPSGLPTVMDLKSRMVRTVEGQDPNRKGIGVTFQ